MLDENYSPNVPKAKAKGSKGKTIEQQYQKKTQLEHILLRPDTYVGSVEPHTQPMWVLDAFPEASEPSGNIHSRDVQDL